MSFKITKSDFKKALRSIANDRLKKEAKSMKKNEELKKEIDEMSHIEMARIWRFELNSPYFTSDTRIHDYFQEKFKEKGGMTSSISKIIGWDN